MSFLNLRLFLNLLAGLDVAAKIAMDLLLMCKSKTWGNIAVDAFLNCYVYVLCTTCDLWFILCCDFAIALIR